MNNAPQWAFASNVFARLDGKLPYAISPGNHDMKRTGDTELFKRHFPASRFAAKPWYVGNSGVDLWKKLYSRHANIFLVVSGDQGQVKICRVDEKGEQGNMVHSIMQDTGKGYIRLFRFIPSKKRIACYTIDPGNGGKIVHHNGCWRDDAWFNFELPYPSAR